MDISVLNKEFLDVLAKLDINTSLILDKSFDGLFATKRQDVDYFLEWFVENITSDNVLTKDEIVAFNVLRKTNPQLLGDDFDSEVIKCEPSYEELDSLNEEYVTKALAGQLRELSVTTESLHNLSLNLEFKYNEITKKQNQFKEEFHKEKKKLVQLSEEFYSLNSTLNSLEDYLSSYKLENYMDSISYSAFKAVNENEEKLIQFFSKHVMSHDQELCDIDDFKEVITASKYFSIVSKGLLEESMFKVSKAEEFLNILKEENDIHVTFDEALSNWCDLNNIKNEHNTSTGNLKPLQYNELTICAAKECDNHFFQTLSEYFNLNSIKNEEEISKFVPFTSHIKRFISENLMLVYILNKTIENEKKCTQAIDKFSLKLSEDKNKVEKISDTLNWKCRSYKDVKKQLNEKHPLMNAIKKLCTVYDKNFQEDTSLFQTINSTKIIFHSLSIYPNKLFNEWENKIAAFMSYILWGPTSQILLKPIELQIEFCKSENLITEHSHGIQKLITEYVNTKEIISSGARGRYPLWINFLKESKAASNPLETVQKAPRIRKDFHQSHLRL